MTRINVVFLTGCLLLMACALPIQAQQGAPANTNCAFTFTTGNGNSYMSYCVTANGNIPHIVTPFGHSQMGPNGEGYGICNESPAQNYTDYATSDTGNWNAATVLSHSGTSVKIARTTSDGNWTLTQTITKVAKTSSITVVMALTNNQAADHVAYLVRYAELNADGQTINVLGATLNSAFGWSYTNGLGGNTPPYYGLQMQNVGTPPFGFWQAYVQNVASGPNACAFALNDSGGFNFNPGGSLVMAYVDSVPAHGTKTVTLTYRGL